jgi:hypothetical protein
MSKTARPFCNHSKYRRPTLRFETLESRQMLSAAPPRVVAVEVASTSWSSDFVSYLQKSDQGSAGYAIPAGSSAQSASLTWTNIDQVIIKFNQDVNITAADLSVSGVSVVAYHFSGFHYDPVNCTATWTLNNVIDADRVRLDLDANGMSPVRNLNGAVLDGEWSNNVSTMSGDGTEGGDFEFTFNVLPSDVNNSGSVSYADYGSIYHLDGETTATSGYKSAQDIDGSGVIDENDYQIVVDRLTQQLPTGQPAGTYNDAPTTDGFQLVQINNATTDVAVALLSHFGDAESGSTGLTYSILSNSQPNLFDTAAINPTTHQLILNAASGVSGRATITVRATDPSGLSVDTAVTVDVFRENQRPIIISCQPANVGAGTWVIQGDVADSDVDLSTFIVQFDGLFTMRATPNEEGHFQFAVVLGEGVFGWDSVIAIDSHGSQSDPNSLDVTL